ncbi:transposase [Glycomyces salinus]|uniref:transposase n=1 Tax=Glycomyces salinus TaxID=980294 RepID=UPI0018EA87CA|nr:transposase [Glycomyces salinus]
MGVRKYPKELKARAIRLCRESDRPIKEIAAQLGIGYETLRWWVRRAEADTVEAGSDPATTDAARVAELEAENAELKRINEILRLASSFFASEIDQTRRWS